MTPVAVLRRRPRLVVALGALFLLLAVAAAIEGGWLLLRWDGPVQRLVENARTSDATAVFRRISFLGSTVLVLSLGPLLAAMSWRRCRAVAIVVLAVTFARPPFEFILKLLVDRDRPNLGRLVDGTGPSFPSGHPMAAAALWGLVPLVVTLYTQNRKIWWAAATLSVALIVAIGASRTYLGVHWLSDVVGGLVISVFLLAGAEWLLDHLHRNHPCTVAHHLRRARAAA